MPLRRRAEKPERRARSTTEAARPGAGLSVEPHESTGRTAVLGDVCGYQRHGAVVVRVAKSRWWVSGTIIAGSNARPEASVEVGPGRIVQATVRVKPELISEALRDVSRV